MRQNWTVAQGAEMRFALRLENFETRDQRKAMRVPTKAPLRFALLFWAPLAVAQSNLGELLDAGAKRLSVEEFKQELVQHVIVGPTLSGASLEVMYASNGVIQGSGS